MRAEGGFTLLEMLVALAVFGLAALALMHLSGQNVRSAALVEERVLAGIVADNRAVDAALAGGAERAAAATHGTDVLADRQWRWQRRQQSLGNGLSRVQVTVYAPVSGQLAAEAELIAGDIQ